MKRRATMVLALVLAVAACGDDDDAADTTAAGPATDATTAPAETTAPADTEPAGTEPAGSEAGGTEPGGTDAGSDCVLDEPLTIGYAAEVAEVGGVNLLAMPGYSSLVILFITSLSSTTIFIASLRK